MEWKTIVPIAVALACYAPAVAIAQENPSNNASVIATPGLTREQFQALPPNALIEISALSKTSRKLPNNCRTFERAG
jgi:hypothetical protein